MCVGGGWWWWEGGWVRGGGGGGWRGEERGGVAVAVEAGRGCGVWGGAWECGAGEGRGWDRRHGPLRLVLDLDRAPLLEVRESDWVGRVVVVGADDRVRRAHRGEVVLAVEAAAERGAALYVLEVGIAWIDESGRIVGCGLDDLSVHAWQARGLRVGGDA